MDDSDEGRQAWRMERSYRNTVYCAGKLLQKGAKVEGRYCSNRWCLVCARVKTGRAINRYKPVLDEWDVAHFVTLTAPNVTGEQLAAELRRYLDQFTAIKRAMKRTHKVPLVAVRKLECTYNAKRDDYHPHFHVVVKGRAGALLLLQLWLDAQGNASERAQDIRPVTPGAIVELFKYFTKLVTRTRVKSGQTTQVGVRVGDAAKLDVIFSAMRGLRVYQPVGFTLPKAEDAPDEEAEVGSDGHTSAPSHTRNRMGDWPTLETWRWRQGVRDWVNDEGEALAQYFPSLGMRQLLDGVERQARGEVISLRHQNESCQPSSAETILRSLSPGSRSQSAGNPISRALRRKDGDR